MSRKISILILVLAVGAYWTRQQGTDHDMRMAVRIFVGAVAGLLVLIARGMKVNPHPLDQNLGIAVHLAGVLLLCCVFFYWKRTCVRAPDFTKHRTRLIGIQFLGAGAIILSVFSLLLLGAFGGELAQTIVSKRIDFLGTMFLLVTAAGALISGFGLLHNTGWAKSFTRATAFFFSFGWPIGLAMAVYVWWALTPTVGPETEIETQS